MKGFHQTTQKDWKDGLDCPYCGKKAEWCENSRIYGKRFGKSYMCYYCESCNAYVGCHQNSMKPLGTMANKELREWRIKTHAVIDPLWKNKNKSRREIYEFLNYSLGYDVHVGAANIEECKEIIKIIQRI